MKKIIIYKNFIGKKYLLVFGAGDNLLYFFDLSDKALLDCVFNLKITKINYHNCTAFVGDKNQEYFINLHNRNLQLGSDVLCQLVWNGNHEKQPKVKMGFNLVGRFVILNNTNQIKYSCKSVVKEYIDIKDLSGVIFRSSIDNLSSYELVKNEILYLSNIRNNLNIDKFNKYGVLYEAPSIAIRFIREQNNLDDYTIYTNDLDSYDELMFYQELWGIKNISYTNNISIDIDKYLNEVWIDKLCYQDLEIKFHSVSGINIIDLDNSNAKLNFYQSNIMALDLIIEKIKLKDLTGIILIDLIKNMTNQQKINIIKRVNVLFECDFRTVKIYGFTNSDMFELVRYK